MANGWPVSALGGKAELMEMFSTTPGLSFVSFLYIATARRVSASDTCCGVVTRIAPATGTVWLRLSATSPVPGGRSMIK